MALRAVTRETFSSSDSVRSDGSAWGVYEFCERFVDVRLAGSCSFDRDLLSLYRSATASGESADLEKLTVFSAVVSTLLGDAFWILCGRSSTTRRKRGSSPPHASITEPSGDARGPGAAPMQR